MNVGCNFKIVAFIVYAIMGRARPNEPGQQTLVTLVNSHFSAYISIRLDWKDHDVTG